MKLRVRNYIENVEFINKLEIFHKLIINFPLFCFNTSYTFSLYNYKLQYVISLYFSNKLIYNNFVFNLLNNIITEELNCYIKSIFKRIKYSYLNVNNST